MSRYQPPKQKRAGQIFDVLVLVILTVGTLYLPFYLGLAGVSKTPAPIVNPTWEALGQSPAAVARWKELGFETPESANEMITARFDYSFEWWTVGLLALIVIGYYVMLVQLSMREYRQVIREKFGDRP